MSGISGPTGSVSGPTGGIGSVISSVGMSERYPRDSVSHLHPGVITAAVALTAIMDIDGTLVDTNYHHAIAWYRALRSRGATLPLWRIHRHIGMGGDQLVTALTGEEFEEEHGDAVREAEAERYKDLIGEVQPLPGARELLIALKKRGSFGGPGQLGEG